MGEHPAVNSTKIDSAMSLFAACLGEAWVRALPVLIVLPVGEYFLVPIMSQAPPVFATLFLVASIVASVLSLNAIISWSGVLSYDGPGTR